MITIGDVEAAAQTCRAAVTLVYEASEGGEEDLY